MACIDSTLSTSDLAILRDLAKRVRDISASPQNQERIRLWYQHDVGAADRPLVLTETDGGMKMVFPDFAPRVRESVGAGSRIGVALSPDALRGHSRRFSD